MIFYLINYVYKKANSQSSDLDGEIHYDCCTILLVYLVETFPSEMIRGVVPNIWNISKFNLMKGKSSYLKQITIQLLSVLFWKQTEPFLQLLLNESQLQAVVKVLCDHAPRLEESQERKRVILGTLYSYSRYL